MNARKRIVLADNQPLTVAGLLHFLSEREDVEVVGQVSSEASLNAMLTRFQPELLIADYNISGFVAKEDIIEAASTFSNLNILIISDDSNKQNILQVLQAGVKGYLTKECSREEVLLAIQSTARGEKFFCHKILNIIMEKHLAPAEEHCEPTVLTIRETEILKLIATGNSTQKVAEHLNLSPHTVHTHRKNIIRKLNIKSPTEFVIYAIDLGLIHPK